VVKLIIGNDLLFISSSYVGTHKNQKESAI